jgi:hypothetical protein
MNPFLLPLRQKTTVEVEYIVFAGGCYDSISPLTPTREAITFFKI